MSANDPLVTLTVDDRVATLRLDRPKVNAINARVSEELRVAAEQIGRRSDIGAVVIWGGPRVFAAGADVQEFTDASYADMARVAPRLQSAIAAIARIPVPVIAAINGYALGGGLELALAADFRVAGTQARLGLPEVTLGLMPGAGGTQRLARLVGPARAKRMVFGGRHLSAADAEGIGLIDQVVPDDAVLQAATEWARTYAHGATMAISAAKQAIDDGFNLDLDSALRLESQLFAGLFATDDKVEGIRSFLEAGPGKATFTGR